MSARDGCKSCGATSADKCVCGVHTCSYECERPACVRRQRDELQRRVAELEAQSPALPMAKEWAEANGWAVTQEWMNGWNAYRAMSHAVATAPRTMWREEWQGSGPQRGWHIRVLNGGNYGSVIAYLGDLVSSDAVQALVSHHNAAILADREGGKP